MAAQYSMCCMQRRRRRQVKVWYAHPFALMCETRGALNEHVLMPVVTANAPGWSLLISVCILYNTMSLLCPMPIRCHDTVSSTRKIPLHSSGMSWGFFMPLESL